MFNIVLKGLLKP